MCVFALCLQLSLPFWREQVVRHQQPHVGETTAANMAGAGGETPAAAGGETISVAGGEATESTDGKTTAAAVGETAAAATMAAAGAETTAAACSHDGEITAAAGGQSHLLWWQEWLQITEVDKRLVEHHDMLICDGHNLDSLRRRLDTQRAVVSRELEKQEMAHDKDVLQLEEVLRNEVLQLQKQVEQLQRGLSDCRQQLQKQFEAQQLQKLQLQHEQAERQAEQLSTQQQLRDMRQMMTMMQQLRGWQ